MMFCKPYAIFQKDAQEEFRVEAGLLKCLQSKEIEFFLVIINLKSVNENLSSALCTSDS